MYIMGDNSHNPDGNTYWAYVCAGEAGKFYAGISTSYDPVLFLPIS